MHLVADTIRSLDDTVQAVDLGQTASEVAFLSFSDSDLGLVAAVHAGRPDLPSLRLAALADLRHPYSVDLWLDAVGRKARFVLVRLLGGLDYWRYGVDELAAAARSRGFDFAVVPGDGRDDMRLDAASTLPVADLRRLWAWFQEGGPENIASALGWIAGRLGREAAWQEPRPLPAHARYAPACRDGDGPLALVTFYRSFVTAADTAPIEELAEALAVRGFAVRAEFVTSLKDVRVVEGLGRLIDDLAPAIVVNTTAFSARLDDGSSVLERAGVPVLQAVLATCERAAWEASSRGLGAADLAMNLVLPEIDGRVATRAISFKGREPRSEVHQYARAVHVPDADGIAAVADLARAWVDLAAKPRGDRRLGLVVSDYPAKGGRTAYAVGLDTPASLVAIAEDLREAGYAIGDVPSPDALMRALEGLETLADAVPTLPLARYQALFAALPEPFRDSVRAAWGDPASDPDVADGAFRFAALDLGALTVAVQPDRGRRDTRKTEYHDTSIPPRHGYVAFYLWLREVVRIDAMIHLGTHGTLEWLPGKAAAPSPACAPAAVLGPVPVVYPFVVNNPGEAAQAKRRIAAVTVGHMTPPLARADSHGAAAEIEALLDEFSQAQSLDARRAKMLAAAILEKARETGLAAESGIAEDTDAAEALTKLDAWLCDLKDARIGDGLHVFARPLAPGLLASSIAALSEGQSAEAVAGLETRLAACAEAERRGLITALDGRFLVPGPAGAPSRGRLDVLPTGRNLHAVDPRGVPTRTAWEIGKRTADEVIATYVQDHGEWPRRIVLDLWGSATMRTGGDDLAQGLALMGVRPVWDAATARVSGFEIQVPAKLGRPRVDVTLRVSGLFRDVFPAQIALFDEAVRAVAALDEADEDNPLAEARRAGATGEDDAFRVFGTAPGAYGVGLSTTIATGAWESRDELGERWLAASHHAYGRDAEGVAAPEAFAARVAGADAFVHVQDTAEQDVLDSDAFAEHEGGFAAAAARLGNTPVLYHADTTRIDRSRVRTLAREIQRVVRARATNPRWLAGQMRHGHRGAAEIAETVGNLLGFAATTDQVAQTAFDLVFDATLGDDRVRDFMVAANPRAAAATARAFDEAIRRGLWATRRNSVAGRIAETLEAGR
ncbi:MAG: cobaltochelatase subunit CobN [Siculibacillus sp.]|nr:cobaltochelatase subunit CobN [Siculibacillus sp.]